MEEKLTIFLLGRSKEFRDMKQYKSLDAAKFVCAILIIILHTAPFSSYSKILTFGFRNIVTVIAVPFFFTTSGFLAFQKVESLEEKAKNCYIGAYLRRLAIMYLIWSAVYFGFVVVKWVRKGFSAYFVLEYIRDFFFEGSYSTIWFLPALFSAVLFVYLLRKKYGYRTIFGISCFIYLFTLGGSSYYGLVTKIPMVKMVYDQYYSFFDTIKNGVCFGMIYVSMGALLAEKEGTASKDWPMKKAILQLAVIAVLLAVEEFMIAYFDWNTRGVDTTIMLVPFSYVLMRILFMIELNVSNSACIAMRKYSILLFLCQRIPLSVIDLFMADTMVKRNSLLYFAAVLSSTFLIAYLLINASKKFQILKWAF